MAKRKAKNSNLTRAKKAKNDEFYTQASDVEKELKHYRQYFKNKVVYCNCDDPTYSEFWRYFHLNFHFLGLKELISTHYDEGKPTYALFYRGGRSEQDDGNFNYYDEKKDLKQDGDFRSEESIELLKRCDIVVTNPPFSLERSYIRQLMEYKKQFIVMGNKNAITYKELFPLLQHNKMWLGIGKPQAFKTPQGTTKRVAGLVRWFTNVPVDKSTDRVILFKHFDLANFPVYDNYAAFNVDKVVNIPVDHQITVTLPLDRLDGFQKTYDDDLKILKQDNETVTMQITRPIWGVPITFMDKYNPSTLTDSTRENERERERERALGKQIPDYRIGQIHNTKEETHRRTSSNQQQANVCTNLHQIISQQNSTSLASLNTDQMDHGISQNQLLIEKKNSTESLSGKDELAYRFKVSGITDRQNTSGLRTKKYTIKDTKRFNDLNARCVVLIGGQYKAKYARILIRERKDYEKD